MNSMYSAFSFLSKSNVFSYFGQLQGIFIFRVLIYYFRDSALEVIMSVVCMASVCFIKALEYRHIKRRWKRLTANNPPAGPTAAQVDAEMDRLSMVTAGAHMPDSDSLSAYFSAKDLDLDN